MEIEEISKEDFEDYERVRNSGATNMFNTTQVVALSDNLTKEKCLDIMKHYDELCKKYPNVRED